MVSVETALGKFKNQTISSNFGFFFEENSVRKITDDYRDTFVFEKLRFQNDFRSHENAKPAFSNSSSFNSVEVPFFLTD